MFIITVIPIARGITKEVLTYVSAKKLEPGSLLDVPLRKKRVKALVLRLEDARVQKLALRSASFMLRKVDELNQKKFLPSWYMDLVLRMSDHYATSLGAMLYALLSRQILEGYISLSLPLSNKKKKNNKRALEGTFRWRVEKYKRIMDASLKRNKSMVILCPTLATMTSIQEMLAETHFFKKIIRLESKITKKKFAEHLGRIQRGEALVILTTGSFLMLMPENTSALIIEEENSRWFKMRTRPYVDFTKIGEEIAMALDLDVIYGDILLRTKTVMEIKNLERENKNILSTDVLHSKSLEKDVGQEEKKEFETLGPTIEKEINKTLLKDGNVFIWVPRKGYAPVVLCLHCGTTVKCHRCDSPVVLHKGKFETEDNYFLCHHCGEKRSALEKCLNCGSWKLDSFGIGIERVEEEVQKKWRKKMVQIEIGTEKNVTELKATYDLAIIPSIDSLLSLPDFNMDERLFRMVLILKEKTKQKLILKTKHIDLPLLDFIKNEDRGEFHKEQIEKRKRFGYTPFTTLIKVTWRGNKEKIGQEVALFRKNILKWKPSIFPAFIKTVNNKFIMHALIKVEKGGWPDSELLEHLKYLPPSVEVNVDPESLL